jgi:AcrR family transcriptional regulator
MAAAREPRVKAETRRAQAREVALRMIRNGASYQDITLRDIAAELGIPLSTLTYAYVSVSALLDDFKGELNAPMLEAIGDGGLRVELIAYLGRVFDSLRQDPANGELGRYRLSRIGSGDHVVNSIGQSEALITKIRRLGRENYRLPDDLIARLFGKQLDGTMLHWLDQPTDAELQMSYQDMLAFIDLLTLAADPQPLAAQAGAAAFVIPDYRQAGLPRS